MAELFRTVLTMSLTATVAAAVVMLLRLLLKKLNAPKLVIYLLWVVVLFRMACPASFESSMSLMGFLPTQPEVNSSSGYVGPTHIQWDTGISPGHEDYLAGTEGGGLAVSPDENDGGGSYVITGPDGVSPPRTLEQVFLPPLSAIWISGVLALCLYALVSYLRLKSKVRSAVKTDEAAWETDQIDSPFVLGFFPAKIYLPLGLAGEVRRYVLLHERTHIRRLDHFIKAISFLALALHWFNPVLWLSWYLACRDMEAACDESVLRNTPDDIRQSYSSALLSLAGVRPIRIPLAFGENDVKGRIRGVLKYKKPVVAMVLCSALLVIISGLALAANPVPLPQTPGTLTVTPSNSDGFSLVPAYSHWGGKDYVVTHGWATAPLRTEISGSVDFSIAGPAPDEVAVSDYLLTDGVFSSPNPVRASPYGNDNGRYGLPVQAHPRSTGVGAEERGLLVTARWNSGVSYQECQYVFRLLVPARREGQPTPAPVAFAGGQVLPLYEGDDFSSLPAEAMVAAPVGGYVEVLHPDGITLEELSIYSLIDNSFITGSSSTMGAVGPNGPDASFGFGGSASSLPEDPGPVGVRLTYTYPDGSQKVWQGLIQVVDDTIPPEAEELTTSPELDADHFRLRFPGDADWTDLDALIPVPKSWATDTLAGRDRARNMDGVLDSALGQIGFLSPTDGWLAFCLSTNLGPVDDTYFYRTFDGGRTWEEYSHFTARDISENINWFGVSCADFFDSDNGYLAMGFFDDAPVFRTTNGGRTWELLDLPLPIGNWACSDIWAGGSRLTFTDPEGNTCTVYSVSGEDSWRLFLPIDDPEQIPSDQLPWPVYLGADEEFFPSIDNWYYDPITLIGFSADRTAAAFTFDESMTGLSGLLLCHGGHLNYFPDLRGSDSPRMTSANPVWGDFDEDGAMELAVIPCVGTGTGVSMWDLHIFEQDGKDLVLGGSIRAYDFRDLSSAGLEGAGLPENARVGSNIYFEAENGGLRASIGIEDVNGIPSVSYIGTLECDVNYDGRSLTFENFKYTETPS